MRRIRTEGAKPTSGLRKVAPDGPGCCPTFVAEPLFKADQSRVGCRVASAHDRPDRTLFPQEIDEMAGAATAICGPGACYPFAPLGPDTASAMMPGKPFDGDVIDLQRGNARLQDPLGKMPCLAQSPGIGLLAVADGFEPAGKRCQMLI